MNHGQTNFESRITMKSPKLKPYNLSLIQIGKRYTDDPITNRYD